MLVDDRRCPHCGATLRTAGTSRVAVVAMGLTLAGCPDDPAPLYGVTDGFDETTTSSPETTSSTGTTAADTGETDAMTGTTAAGSSTGMADSTTGDTDATGSTSVGEPDYGVPESTG